MIDGLLRKFGYISEKNLIAVAMEVYINNDFKKAIKKEDWYYNCGNANAVSYILSRFGLDVTKIIKETRHNREDEE
jgi:hypothetical protein